MTHVLVLHGNGGSRTRFIPLLRKMMIEHPEINLVIPQLSGFDGRVLPPSDNYWDLFLEDVYAAVAENIEEEWVLYGHGIGGSLLMELAARDFTFPNGQQLKVRKVYLHSIIGAALHTRKFPLLMKPMALRKFGKWLVTRAMLRPMWEKRLFQNPEEIPLFLREQFFIDYTICDAFVVFFDLITVPWYREVRSKTHDYPFHLIWGKEERVVKVEVLDLWREDFPKATVEIVADWDHFPMLEQPEAFAEKFLGWVR
ncbi:MAG: alpha/beta hydrolase [Bacteroidota bacterium]